MKASTAVDDVERLQVRKRLNVVSVAK